MQQTAVGLWLIRIGLGLLAVAGLAVVARALGNVRGVSLQVSTAPPVPLAMLGAALLAAGWLVRHWQRVPRGN